MKGKRHRPEQIIRKLREADGLLAEGKTIAEVLPRPLFQVGALIAR